MSAKLLRWLCALMIFALLCAPVPALAATNADGDTDDHADPNAGFGSIRRGKGRGDPSGRKWGRE